MQDLYGNLPPRVGELLEEIGRRGVSLRVAAHEDRLNYWPKDKLSPELVEELRHYKAEIIEVIRWDEERKTRREGNVRDELEVLETAREKFRETA
jgi:hypothetical protein